MIIVAPAGESDIAAIQRIYASLRRPPRPLLDVAEFLVARDDERVVGCAGVHAVDPGGPEVTAKEGYLYGLAVQREFQRKGVGRALTEARVERVRTFGGERAVALAMFWNAKFFRSLGFDTTPRKSLSRTLLALPDFTDSVYRHSAVMSKCVK